MAKKNSYAGGFRLTLTKARQLAIQELGTAKGLEAESGAMPGWFIMRMGNLVVRINPDIRGSGCVLVSVSMLGASGYCEQYHDPETLKENFEVEERYRVEERRDTLNEWVDFNGPEFCHAEIDRVWKKLVGA